VDTVGLEFLLKRIEETPSDLIVNWVDTDLPLLGDTTDGEYYGNVTEDGFDFAEIELKDVLKAFLGEYIAYREALDEKHGKALSMPEFRGHMSKEGVIKVGWRADAS